MRLDQFLVDKGFVTSRNRAQMLIDSSDVFVNGSPAIKAAQDVEDDDEIAVNDSIKYVSRAGLKLDYALERFQIDPYRLHCLDIGSSTGGFTDVLLQKGAGTVTSVDVGKDQMDEELRNHKQVDLFEQTDIRDFFLDKKFDLIVMDVSFISQKKLVPSISRFAKEGTVVVSLIKPQFEVGSKFLTKRGIVNSLQRTEDVIQEIIIEFEKKGFALLSEPIPSPIKGGEGNIEYLVAFIYN